MADLWQLGLVFVLIALNAGFAGSELALLSLREAQLSRLEVTSTSGRTVARLARNQNRFLATIQIGITLAGFLASATAAVSLAKPLVPAFGVAGDADEFLAIVVVTLALTFVTLVFGEIAPKRIAMQHAERWALLVGRPLDLLARLVRPVVWALSASTDAVVRLVGADPDRQREEVTEEEIRELITSQPGFTPDTKAIIWGALDVEDRRVRDVMVPRVDVFSLPADLTTADALDALLESGHSRAPVFGETVDDVVGVVHLRDLLTNRAGTLGAVAVPILPMPDSTAALSALRHLQRARQQLAMVTDEYGGFAGIVTVEDLVEEVVGEIYDESDPRLEVASFEGGAIELPGGYPMHELADLGIRLPEGAYTTLAGFVIDALGEIPATGTVFEHSGWSISVEEATSTRLVRLRIEPS